MLQNLTEAVLIRIVSILAVTLLVVSNPKDDFRALLDRSLLLL